MNFTTPNSAGFPDFEETNTASSHAWLLNARPEKRKKRFREYNDCHAPDTGRFCSKGGTFSQEQARRQSLRDQGFAQVKIRPGRIGGGERFWVPKDKARNLVRRGEADLHKDDAGILKTARPFAQRMAKTATAGKRANRVMKRLEGQMKKVGGNVGRALSLRKRMDVAGPLAYRQRQNSFIGSVKRVLGRSEPYRGKKR